METCQNDGDPNLGRSADTKEYDITRTAYGIQVPIFVAKNFIITPSIYFYDNDGGAWNGAKSTAGETDYGTETVAGVQFQLVF